MVLYIPNGSFFFILIRVYFKLQNLQVFMIVSAISRPKLGGVDLHLAQDVLKIISRLLYRM